MSQQYAAVGVELGLLVVWALGDSAAEAELLAYSEAAPADPLYLGAVPVTDEQAKRIHRGEVSCTALGIRL